MNLERSTSRDTSALGNRIRANNAFGSADLGAWLVDRLAVPPGAGLLDIGCGTATHLVRLAEQGARCTGIDVSASSLAAARDAANAAGVAIRFAQADMNSLPEAEHAFDLITFIYSLYYADDPRSVLTRALSMLSSDGAIAVFGPYDDNNRDWFDFIAPFVTLDETVVRSTTSFMHDVVVAFGMDHFEDVRCARFVNAIEMPTLDELRRYWRSNIYYDEAADQDFEDAARAHFAANQSFRFQKVGSLVLMKRRFR